MCHLNDFQRPCSHAVCRKQIQFCNNMQLQAKMSNGFAYDVRLLLGNDSLLTGAWGVV